MVPAPGLFAIMYIAVKVGLTKNYQLGGTDVIELVAGISGLIGGLLTYLSGRRNASFAIAPKTGDRRDRN
jgi:hypothetical protein